MQNAWHAITTDTANTTRDHHGIYDTREEALSAAMGAATDREVAFAVKEDPDYPSDEYAGLPDGLTSDMVTFAQVATIQRCCDGCREDCTAHVHELHNSGDPVVIRRASWDADAGMWYRRAIRVLPTGESHEVPHVMENCVQV